MRDVGDALKKYRADGPLAPRLIANILKGNGLSVTEVREACETLQQQGLVIHNWEGYLWKNPPSRPFHGVGRKYRGN